MTKLDKFIIWFFFVLQFIYSLVHRAVVPGNLPQIQLRRRQSELKVAKVTAMNVIAFLLSWAPYCCVSLTAVFTKQFVLVDWEAEIPELLAKASVIYGPIIYSTMHSRFQATLFRILHFRRRVILAPQFITDATRNNCSTRMATDRTQGTLHIDQRYLQPPLQAMKRRVAVSYGGTAICKRESSVFVSG